MFTPMKFNTRKEHERLHRRDKEYRILGAATVKFMVGHSNEAVEIGLLATQNTVKANLNPILLNTWNNKLKEV